MRAVATRSRPFSQAPAMSVEAVINRSVIRISLRLSQLPTCLRIVPIHHTAFIIGVRVVQSNTMAHLMGEGTAHLIVIARVVDDDLMPILTLGDTVDRLDGVTCDKHNVSSRVE